MNLKKTIMTVILSVILISSSFLFLSSAAAGTEPILSIVQSGTNSNNVIPSASVGSIFNVDVRVDNTASISPGINGASFSITWNPTVLNCTSTSEGTAFWGNKMSDMGFIPPDNTIGLVMFGQIIMDTSNPLAVSTQKTGVLATLTFQVLKVGQSNINIQPTDVGVPWLTYPKNGSIGTDSIGLTTLTTNATYGAPAVTPSPTPSSSTAPQGTFTPTDGSILALGSTVTLDASSSKPGYDTAGGFVCNISSFAWRVEYLNGTTFTSSYGKTASFVASVEGTFRIILILTAVDPQPSDANFKVTGSTTATVYVISNPQVTKVDVYTDKGGIGANVSSPGYSPLQTLYIYAQIKNNNISLSEQIVLFTILSSNKTIIATQQGVTNNSGIAQSQFRLPCPDPNSPAGLGIWYIIASVSFLNLSVNDSLAFDFGYASYLSGFQKVQIPTSIHRLETLPIQVTVNNSYYPSQWSQLSITIFDQAGIPIGSSTVSTSQTQILTIIDSNIAIPSWAFVGQATLYICLLSNSSNSQAIPLSPETWATFNILP